MSATDELKQCPFCGGEAEIVGDDYMEWIAECVECCASSMSYATKAEAIAAWNSRAEQSSGCLYCRNGKKGFDGQIFMVSNHGTQTINYCPNCGKAVKR